MTEIHNTGAAGMDLGDTSGALPQYSSIDTTLSPGPELYSLRMPGRAGMQHLLFPDGGDAVPAADREFLEVCRHALWAHVEERLGRTLRLNEQIPYELLVEAVRPKADPGGEYGEALEHLLASAGRAPSAEDYHRNESIFGRTSGNGLRVNGYAGAINGALTEAGARVARGNVFNAPLDEAGHSLDLSWRECRELAGRNALTLRERVAAIAPMHDELRTGMLAASYLQETTGHVTAVSTGINPAAEAEVRGVLKDASPSALVSQSQILRHVDWHLVSTQCAVPLTGVNGSAIPHFKKGGTLLAGLLARYAAEDPPREYLALYDTDVTDPYHFRGAEYMALPITFAREGDRPTAIIVGRTGPGRNNETWTHCINSVLNDVRGYQSETRKLAAVLGTIIWPLCGHRIATTDFLYSMPIASGMAVESQFNLCAAGLQAERPEPVLFQVNVPVPLIEKAVNSPEREMPMINLCADWTLHALRATDEWGVPPHRWGVEEVRLFNRRYGEFPLFWGFYQSSAHAPNHTAQGVKDYLLPSVRDLGAMGAVDWDGIRRVLKAAATQSAT